MNINYCLVSTLLISLLLLVVSFSLEDTRQGIINLEIEIKEIKEYCDQNI